LPANTSRPTSRPWWTIAQVAEYWQISDETVRRMIQRGELPAYHVGRNVRIKAEDLGRITEPVEVA
jgi:excisionase family DNA binding protein